MTEQEGLSRLLAHLERTEWTPPELIASLQLRQLGRLVSHATVHSAHFRRRLENVGLTANDLTEPGGLSRLPALTRRDVQAAGSDLFCEVVPPDHGDVRPARTSGSTGEPVEVRKTGMTMFLWLAMTLRDHRWHARDVTGRLCSIRPGHPTYEMRPTWGPPTSLVSATGPTLALSIGSDASQLVAWVAEFAPSYLLVYPSTLEAMVRHCQQQGQRLPSLREVRTIGETVRPPLRQLVRNTLGVSIVDCYSCREAGYIALTCPESGLYHVMSEGVIAEVVDDRGRPCEPGSVGRVLVTDLHNFATPLVRYEIGDYAEVAPPCRCGRGLPTWARIVGRQRNLMLRTNGTRHWPLTGFYDCRDVAPVVQYQFIQHDRRSVEARLVTERPLTSGEQNALRARFDAATGGEFSLRFSFLDGPIPPATSGKFEDFVCLATPEMAV